MKRFIILLILCTTLLSCVAVAENVDAFLSNKIKITVNEKEFVPRESDGTQLRPIIYDSRTYLPLRSLAEALGAEVDYDAQTKTVSITSSDEEVLEEDKAEYSETKLPISVVNNDSAGVYANGTEIETNSLVYNERVYLPVRKIGDALGAEVRYDTTVNTVMIMTKAMDNTIIQLQQPVEGDTIAEFDTSKGIIKAKLMPEYAPKAVENFVSLAESGYYDSVIFHRVINNFVIQSGDPTGTGTGGTSIWGEDFENELSPKARHFRGALCMANAGPDTNQSQFYIVQNPKMDESSLSYINEMKNSVDPAEFESYFPSDVLEKYIELGGYPSLDFQYTVFGQVFEGMDIVDAIATAPVDENNYPLEDIFINAINIYTYSDD